MTNTNEIIIWGGGDSIKEGLELGLIQKLLGKFVIGTNYSYKFYIPTFLCFADKDFYKSENLEKNPYIYDELKNLPLIVGIDHDKNKEIIHPNTILCKYQSFLRQNQSAKEGFYTRSNLTGIFALSVACFLLNYKGIIYLLGFDWTNFGNTHFYSKKEINHRGVGYINYYSTHKPQPIFDCYNVFKDIKIYNISLKTNITTFEKINYFKFFEILKKEDLNQEELRKEIRNKLTI